MRTLVKKLGGFLRESAGPTVVEYAVLLVLIIFGALTAISLLGVNLSTSLASTAEALPLGVSGEDSSESSQNDAAEDEGEDEENGRGGRGRGGGGRGGRGGRGRGGRGRGGRASALPANSSNPVRCA